MTSEIFQRIQEDSNEALRNHDQRVRLFLSALIGDIKARAKDDGNRLPTDEDVVFVIRKNCKANQDMINTIANVHPERAANLAIDQRMMDRYLPQEIPEQQIFDEAIKLIEATNGAPSMKLVGTLIKALKERHGIATPANLSQVCKNAVNLRMAINT